MRPVAIAFCLLVALPSFARADCPVSHILTGSQGFGQGYDFDAAEGNLGVPSYASFSWPTGYFHFSGNTGTDWGVTVDATERFQLVGPVSATPLAFSARLRATGSVQANGYGSVGITEIAGPTNVLTVAPGQTISDVPIVLNLQHYAGDSFDLNVELQGGSNTFWVAVNLQAAFEFVNVPAGWSIVSCRGEDVPVPATPMTWGRLRAQYR